MIAPISLTEMTTIRFFAGDKRQRKVYLRRFRGRWQNDSHFVRCAVQVFMRQLDQEELSRAMARKVKA